MAAQSNLKKVSLELGGKSPNIVFPDADLDEAVKYASMGVYFNHGQCCCAGSRLFVHEDIYDKFLDKFQKHVETIRIGNPLEMENTHGPIVDNIQYERVMSYIKKGTEEGATLKIGGMQPSFMYLYFLGKRIGSVGYFIHPTLFSDVSDDMTIAREEIFGPVVCAMKFKTVEEVITRANNTAYGLAAAVHTKDINLANRLTNELEAGTVWVNCYNVFMNQV